MATIGYIRVSTDKQNTANQEHAILKYANDHDLQVTDWIKVKVSSRQSVTKRKIDVLMEQVTSGDIIIVSELSRLARSVGQISNIVDALIKNNVRTICIKESIDINGGHSLTTKIQTAMFSLFAELERDLISERTKEGLQTARAKGRLIGRPKGQKGKTKLDGKESEIKGYLDKGLNITNISKLMNVSRSTLAYFVKTRELISV